MQGMIRGKTIKENANAMRTSTNYQFTLPVVRGVIQDPQNTLGRLQYACIAENQRRRVRVGPPCPTRWVVDLKYRGPRGGRPYTTPREAAYAVDVYKRLRREWV